MADVELEAYSPGGETRIRKEDRTQGNRCTVGTAERRLEPRYAKDRMRKKKSHKLLSKIEPGVGLFATSYGLGCLVPRSRCDCALATNAA